MPESATRWLRACAWRRQLVLLVHHADEHTDLPVGGPGPCRRARWTCRGKGLGLVVSGVLQGAWTYGLQEQPFLVQNLLARRDAEEQRVEAVDAVEEAAPPGRTPRGHGGPSGPRDLGDAVAAERRFRRRTRRGSPPAGGVAAYTDDRDVGAARPRPSSDGGPHRGRAGGPRRPRAAVSRAQRRSGLWVCVGEVLAECPDCRNLEEQGLRLSPKVDSRWCGQSIAIIESMPKNSNGVSTSRRSGATSKARASWSRRLAAARARRGAYGGPAAGLASRLRRSSGPRRRGVPARADRSAPRTSVPRRRGGRVSSLAEVLRRAGCRPCNGSRRTPWPGCGGQDVHLPEGEGQRGPRGGRASVPRRAPGRSSPGRVPSRMLGCST